MNFVEALKNIFKSSNEADLKESRFVTKSLGKLVDTNEDIVQFAQFKYLVELNGVNFIYEIFKSHKKIDDLLSKLDFIVANFDKAEISPQIYSCFLYVTLKALEVQTNEIKWTNPFNNGLDSEFYGDNFTFGTGLFIEDLNEFEIENNVIKSFSKKRKYLTIPNGAAGVEASAFSNDKTMEFVTIPSSLEVLPKNMLANCTNVKNILMSPTVKIIPEEFCKNNTQLTLVVASGVKEIRSRAFENSAISSVKFVGGDNLERIATEAFKECSNLRKIDIANVKDVAPLAFLKCINATDVSMTLNNNIYVNNYKFTYLFETDKADFASYDKLKNVTIKVLNGEIPDGFFENCAQLTNITVVGEIKKIGANAFKGCSNLEKVDMQFVGEYLEANTFAGCAKLNSLPSFKTVETIGNNAFANCLSIAELEFPKLKKIGTAVFKECNKLAKLTISFDFDILPDYTFYGCSSLRDYSYLSVIKRAGSFALGKMTFTDKFKIPKSMKGIQTNAFDGSSFEGTLVIPKDCKINTEAFSNLAKISSIVYRNLEIVDLNNVQILPHSIFVDNIDQFNENFKQLTNLELEVNAIAVEAFKGWVNLEKVVIDAPFIEIPRSCFEDCTKLNTVVLNVEGFQLKSNSFNNCTSLKSLTTPETTAKNALIDLTAAANVESNVFTNCTSIEEINLNITEENIADRFKLGSMFEEIRVELLKKYTAFKTVVVNIATGLLPDFYFDGCETLVNIKVVGELTKFSEGLFRNCAMLEKLEMEYTGNNVPKECFKNCASIKEMDLLPKVKTLDNEAFSGCKSLTKLVLPTSISKIGVSTFENCISLVDLAIKYSGAVVPVKCFNNCKSLRNFKFLEKVTKIQSYGLANVEFPEGYLVPVEAVEIESHAYSNSMFNGDLFLPNAKIINELAFEAAKGFKRIEFKNANIVNHQTQSILPYRLFDTSLDGFNSSYKNVDGIRIHSETICDDAFKDWKNIKDVNMSNDVKTLPNSCFEGCSGLEKINLPYYDIALGKNVFNNCVNLRSVNFEDESTNLNTSSYSPKETYRSCTKLEKISISIDNTVLKNSLRLFNYFADTLEEFNEKYQNLSLINIRSKVKEIPEGFFEGCTNLTGINVLDDILLLNDYSFANCPKLEKLTMNFVGDVIPKGCFSDCTALTSIYNLKQVTTIEENAFENCKTLTSIQFKTPIVKLGARAFSKCRNLEKINMYYTGEFLPSQCFSFCEGLLNTPKFTSLVFVDNSAFEGCINIDNVYINGIEGANFVNIFPQSKRINKINYCSNYIPTYFFSGLKQVEEINFTKKVLTIGDYAFESVRDFVTIRNLNYVESVGDYAFANSEIEYQVLPACAKYIGVGVFAGCEKLKYIELPVRYLYAGALFDSTTQTSTKSIVQTNGLTKREYTIPASLEKIFINDGVLMPGVFSGMKLDIEVNHKVKEIAEYSFYDCNDVSFNKPESIEVVKPYAFANIDAGEITLKNVKTIEEFAFNKAELETLNIGPNLRSMQNTSLLNVAIANLNVEKTEFFEIENEMVVDIKKAKIIHANNVEGDLVIPANARILDSRTFVNCNKVTSINTNKVQSIKTDALIGCMELSRIDITSENILMEKAFINNCPRVEYLTLSFLGSDPKTSMNLDYLYTSFPTNLHLKELTILGGVLSDTAFKDINTIGDVNLEGVNVNTLNKGSLANLVFDKLVLPKSTKEISELAFDNTVMKNVEVNKNSAISVDSNCIYINNKVIYCFNDKVTDLSLPKNLVSIYENAFEQTKAIDKVDIANNDMQLNKAFAHIPMVNTVSVGNMNTRLADEFKSSISNITVIAYKDEEINDVILSGINEFNQLDLLKLKDVTAKSFVSGGETVFIDTLNTGINLTSIDQPFFDAAVINNLNMSNRLFKTFNNMLVDLNKKELIYAGQNIPSSVDLDFGVVKIKDNVFANNKTLVNIDTKTVEIIGNNVFENCPNLKTVHIPNNCKEIGEEIFNKTMNIDNVSMPFIGKNITTLDNIKYLGRKGLGINTISLTNQPELKTTFAYSKGIIKIHLSDVTKKINSKAFDTAVDVKELHIPNTLQLIDNNCFANCKARLTVHAQNKLQTEKWPLDWRRVKEGKLFAHVKVQYREEIK